MECKKVSVSVFVCLYYKICRDSFIACARACVIHDARLIKKSTEMFSLSHDGTKCRREAA